MNFFEALANGLLRLLGLGVIAALNAWLGTMEDVAKTSTFENIVVMANLILVCLLLGYQVKDK